MDLRRMGTDPTSAYMLENALEIPPPKCYGEAYRTENQQIPALFHDFGPILATLIRGVD